MSSLVLDVFHGNSMVFGFRDLTVLADNSHGFGLQSRAQEFIPSTAAEVLCPFIARVRAA
jgi:hypothetical protein